MPRFARFILLLTMLSLLVATAPAMPADEDVPFVRLVTDEGEILAALFPDLAPNHVANFLHLSDSGFYDGTYFHRIMEGFMIQGGDGNSKDFDPRNDGQGNPGLAELLNEEERSQLTVIEESLASRGYVASLLETPIFLKAEFSTTAMHLRGTLSMARRTRPVDSAGSQFFICHERGRSTADLDGLYTVFGQVVTGMDIVDRIATADKDRSKGRDFPATPVSIKSVEITTGVAGLTADEQQAFRAMLEELATAGSTW